MASVNKVIIVGHLGRDPEVRFMHNGAAVCSLSIATSRVYKDQESGNRKEETEWHRVVMFNRLAEIAGEYLAKGRPVYIEGRLQTRKWQNRDGQDQYTTEIVADQMQMLGGRGDSGAQYPSEDPQPDSQSTQAPQNSKKSKSTKRAPAASGAANLDDIDDDIPF